MSNKPYHLMKAKTIAGNRILINPARVIDVEPGNDENAEDVEVRYSLGEAEGYGTCYVKKTTLFHFFDTFLPQ